MLTRVEQRSTTTENLLFTKKLVFKYIIKITPLGFLYGSAGAFLSPENLVGRSGNSFPPSSATVSGLFAYRYAQPENGSNSPEKSKKVLDLPDLQIVGPFWAKNNDVENFYVPTPFNYLVKLEDEIEKDEVAKKGNIKYKQVWKSLIPPNPPCEGGDNHQEWMAWDKDKQQWLSSVTGKFDSDTWIPIKDWDNPTTVWGVWGNPWEYKPHLHPRIDKKQRIVYQEEDKQKGSLFLENAVQMHPDTCLVYLTTEKLEEGWYRFGGEGHLVELECIPISDDYLQDLLQRQTGNFFALITPAVWGSNHLSYRFPIIRNSEDSLNNEGETPPQWKDAQLITERAKPYRYRLGGEGKTKRLSRGRYAVPAGTVYQLEQTISKAWLEWDDNWFPFEGYSYKRWGCGLALPLPSPTNST